MQEFARLFWFGLLSIVLCGCASHPIRMNPDLDSIQARDLVPIDKHVGYHISEVKRRMEVTTAGGGGDKVNYLPYRDIEVGFYKALTKVFRGVSRINNPSDKNEIHARGVSLLIVPEISTASSSSSPVMWHPTSFIVNLTCTVTDSMGQPVRTLTVTGTGKMDFTEFKVDPSRGPVHATNEELPNSLAAVRATNDALSKLITALGEAHELRK